MGRDVVDLSGPQRESQQALVYATRRPEREEYDFLYGRFSEFLVHDLRRTA